MEVRGVALRWCRRVPEEVQ
uniref:Uncharacterized protein n=1 Tax=Anguilla anguilla TaxID=7936 RepID=A0A0E9Q9J6_ANGAN